LIKDRIGVLKPFFRKIFQRLNITSHQGTRLFVPELHADQVVIFFYFITSCIFIVNT